MTDQAKPIPRPWRRFLRFSVRGLIVLVIVNAGCLGWIVRSARIQRQAVAAIHKMNDEVHDQDNSRTYLQAMRGETVPWNLIAAVTS